MSMPKASIVGWFLRRPRYFRQFGRVARQSVGRRIGGNARELSDRASRAAAERWCAARAVETGEAVRLITSRPIHESIRETHARALQDAETVAKALDAGVPALAAHSTPLGGPGNIELLYQLAEWIHATRAIETGVAYGWSSLALLLSLANRENGRLVSTDMPLIVRDSERYVGVVVPQELRTIWTLIDQPDREGLPRALRELPEFDLCHYDSDKSYRGRLWAYPLLWQSLRPGGVFISDDIGDNTAFQEFCADVGDEPTVVAYPSGEKYTGVVVKNASLA